MAESLATVSALVGVVTFSYQASKALRDTIKSFSEHPKYVRDLREELLSLGDVLLLLEQSLSASNETDYAILHLPIQRCGHACEEFNQALEKCLRRDHADRSSFRGWLKVRWMGSDIHGFKDTLAGYKSTIAIAMAGVNLRTTKASLNVIQEYKDMIQSTTTDLKDHLYTIDNKLHEDTQELDPSEDAVDGKATLEERASTIRCLEICVQVSNYIEGRQKQMSEKIEDDKTPSGQSGGGAESSSAQQIMGDSLQGCRLNIKSAKAQLLNRLQHLSTSLGGTSGHVRQFSSNGLENRDEVVKEIESIRQCLDVCMQATEQAENARINVMDDIETAEDSRQVLVSTIGDLIAAHRVTAGARSLQAIGQMSDETLQQLSRAQIPPPVDSSDPFNEPRQKPQSRSELGRTLGSSNVRTF